MLVLAVPQPVARDSRDLRKKRDSKFSVQSSENLELRTSNRRPSCPSRSSCLSRLSRLAAVSTYFFSSLLGIPSDEESPLRAHLVRSMYSSFTLWTIPSYRPPPRLSLFTPIPRPSTLQPIETSPFCLVCLVHLVSFVQKPDKPNTLNKPNKRDKPDQPDEPDRPNEQNRLVEPTA